MSKRSPIFMPRRAGIICFTIVSAMLAGLGAPALGQRNANGAEGIVGAWYVTRVTDWPGEMQGKPFIRFKPDGTLYGSNGCNSFSGRYKFVGTSVTFSKLKTGRRTCPGKKNAFAIKFENATGRRRTVVMKPGHLVLLDQNRQAMMRLSRKSEDGKTFLAGDSFNQAWWQQKNKNYKAAMRLYSEAIEKDPELYDAYIRRGEVSIKLSQYKNAASDFRQALRIKPKNKKTFNDLAWALFKMTDFAAALKAVNRSLDSHETPHAFDTRAHILHALERTSESVSDYRNAMALGGKRFVRLYQKGLKQHNLYGGALDGRDAAGIARAIETCLAIKACDPVSSEDQ